MAAGRNQKEWYKSTCRAIGTRSATRNSTKGMQELSVVNWDFGKTGQDNDETNC